MYRCVPCYLHQYILSRIFFHFVTPPLTYSFPMVQPLFKQRLLIFQVGPKCEGSMPRHAPQKQRNKEGTAGLRLAPRKNTIFLFLFSSYSFKFSTRSFYIHNFFRLQYPSSATTLFSDLRTENVLSPLHHDVKTASDLLFDFELPAAIVEEICNLKQGFLEQKLLSQG